MKDNELKIIETMRDILKDLDDKLDLVYSSVTRIEERLNKLDKANYVQDPQE